MRIEAVRRLFPQMWFNEDTTEPGRLALGFYHEKKDQQRDVGLGPDHDWSCLAGSTKILTRYGACQIMSLPNQGDILTPCGWKRYENPRVTRTAAPLVEVRFTDGHSVKCTPDHLFLTASGWRYAESLAPGLPIRSSLTHSHSISTAACIAYGLVTNILVGAAKSFTETYGQRLSALYQTVTTFITAITIRSTTPWTIWSACPQARTYPTIGCAPRGASSAGSISPRQPDRKRLSGTLLRLVGFGIDGTPNALRVGRSGSASRNDALSAERHSRRLLEKAGTPRFTAVKPAKWLRIESVKKLSERQDVWCLTVPETGCFSLENGAVVHNSHAADAFGLMAICYKPPSSMASFHKPIKYPKHSVV